MSFLVFFLAVWGIYLRLPHRKQNVLLLLASYFFYGCWDYRFLGLIAFSTILDYGAGLRIAASENIRVRRGYLWISVVLNLGILGYFKYSNFFIENAEVLLQLLGITPHHWRLDIILPVGISFYTFQTMSYTIDVYRRQMSPCRSLIDFATYVAFFPQLVAGPIERASRLLPQIQHTRTVTWAAVQSGFWLIMWGLFKKAVIADNLAGLVDQGFNAGHYQAGSVLMSVYAFAFQIYCDFSGYSDMARGLARWLGIELMVNFNNPYFAVNPSDFWRRWHISLSTWLRDYLYIPLGGNRKGPVRTYVNLSLTMLLGGIWHGAAWTFVIWGVYQGGLLMVHRAWSYGRKETSTERWTWLRRILMFHAVCMGWLLFRAQSLGQVGSMFAAFWRAPTWDLWAANSALAIFLVSWPLWVVQYLQERTKNLDVPAQLSLFPRTALYATVTIMLLVMGNAGGKAFIYFQF